LVRISEYPFTPDAAEMVRSAGYSLESLLDKVIFQPVRSRALERVRGAIDGQIPERRPDTEAEESIELLSYPMARVMISCLGDDLLLKRYAMAEAKLAYSRMQEESLEDLLALAGDLGLNPSREGDLLKLHFIDYLHGAHRLKSPRWKLVNRDLRGGMLTITQSEFSRLLEEVARDRIQRGLPLQVEPSVCKKLADYVAPLKSELAVIRANQRADLGQVTESAFPPCIRKMLSTVASGANLAHSARFALTSFLLQINMTPDQVVALFNTSPDFNEEKTRYQVEHIAGSSGTKYKPPSCATMATYGNCPGEDDLCRRIRHPMSYYERMLKSPRLVQKDLTRSKSEQPQ